MQKVVLITGSGRRLGKAFAIALSRAGYAVAAAVRTSDDVAPLKARLGDASRVYVCDITNSTQCAQVVRMALNDFGRIDVLVNNAGIYMQKSFTEASPSEVQQVFDVVVTGTASMTTAVLPAMQGQKSGHIITISDVHLKSDAHVPHGAGEVDLAAKSAKLASAKLVAVTAAEYGVASTMFYMKWVASELDIDDDSPAPNGVTHPADAVKALAGVIESGVAEFSLPPSN